MKQRRELILMLAALTKVGKTTLAKTLSHRTIRRKMAEISNCRTEVTTDWTYDPETESIRLVKAEINYKGIFGAEIKENFKCEKFNEILNSDDGSYLKKVFGLEEQTDLTADELMEYVENKIQAFVDNSNEESLAVLIKDRKSNQFLRRIKVVVPPSEEFGQFLCEAGVTLVLRDTRGLLDMDPEEAEKIPNWSMQELGLDGIHAVLLLGTPAEFPDTVQMYKKAYQRSFQSVPVFLMARQSAELYYSEYEDEEENTDLVNEANVQEFLQNIKSSPKKRFARILKAFAPFYRFLEAFEIGTLTGTEFQYTYQVYPNEELRYICPDSSALQCAGTEEPDYDDPDYRLYEMIAYENFKDIVSKMVKHESFREAIAKNGSIYQDFVTKAKNTTNSSVISMCPGYQKYSRNDVNRSILCSNYILGPNDGITTIKNGNILYLGAVTSAVSTLDWLYQVANGYIYSGTLKKEDGTGIIDNQMSETFQRNLIRMSIFKVIEDSIDRYAYFRDRRFINRYKVVDAIWAVRRKHRGTTDALTQTALELLQRLF